MYDHQQTINAPLLHAIELCIDSLRASQIVKPPHDIHTGDTYCHVLYFCSLSYLIMLWWPYYYA